MASLCNLSATLTPDTTLSATLTPDTTLSATLSPPLCQSIINLLCVESNHPLPHLILPTRLFEAASHLLHSVIGNATERVVGLLSRLFKLQARITRSLVNLKVTSLPPLYSALALSIAQCSHKIETFLVAVSVVV